jgi:hypothetical protein
MKISAPIITLLAGGALAGGLLVANGLTAGGATGSASVQAGAASADAANEKAANDAGTEDKKPAAGASGEGTATAGATADAKKKVRHTYAGRVKGGGPLLAISVRDGVAVAYLCDGKLEAWFKGKAEAGRLTLTGNGAKLSGTFNADRARGSVSVVGRTWEFHTPTVTKPSGLWKATAEVRGAKVQAGWVVLADGTQVGLFTRNGAGGTAAPRLDTATGTATIDGRALAVVATDAETGTGF